MFDWAFDYRLRYCHNATVMTSNTNVEDHSNNYQLMYYDYHENDWSNCSHAYWCTQFHFSILINPLLTWNDKMCFVSHSFKFRLKKTLENCFQRESKGKIGKKLVKSLIYSTKLSGVVLVSINIGIDISKQTGVNLLKLPC